MIEQWGLQLLAAIGRMFLNPLLYWMLFLLLIAGARRIKKDRVNFGMKLHGYLNEIKQTLLFTLLFGLFISIVALLFGFVLTIEMIIILAIVTIMLSITGSFHLLSPAYTLGITFFALLLFPLLPWESITFMAPIEMLTKFQFVTFALLIGMLLLVEALLVLRANAKHIYPTLSLGDRGVWLGEQQLKRLAMIPVVLFIPATEVTNFGPFLPYFELGNTTYYLAVIPFLVGVQLVSQTELMPSLQLVVGKQKLMLAVFVLVIAIASYFYYVLSVVAIIVAIVGSEWITYRNRIRNKYGAAVLAPVNEGVKVLATLPDSRAQELEILPGEIIAKVNGIKVSNSQQFYKALQQSGAFFKLDIIDNNNEMRFIQSAFFAEDHHDLGLIFPEPPYRERHKKWYEQLTQL